MYYTLMHALFIVLDENMPRNHGLYGLVSSSSLHMSSMGFGKSLRAPPPLFSIFSSYLSISLSFSPCCLSPSCSLPTPPLQIRLHIYVIFFFFTFDFSRPVIVYLGHSFGEGFSALSRFYLHTWRPGEKPTTRLGRVEEAGN